MNKFPNPPPDRRMNKNQGYYTKKKSDIKENETSDNDKFDSYNNMNLYKIKQIEDMRNTLYNFKLLNDKKLILAPNAKITFNKLNIILFGPSGSGKSSFIKTLYRALYGTSILPPDAINKLIIKDTSENEGTLCFTRFHLKEQCKNTSEIILCDTRGHIWMNEQEKEQFNVLIDGKVKDNVLVQQVKDRNPFLLWEFWKKNSELFPKEIFYENEPGLPAIPHGIVLIFDGSSDDIIDPSEEAFYRDLVDITCSKGHQSVHVVLTRIDIFEKNINEANQHSPQTERLNLQNNLKDKKIQRVIKILGVKRSNVHFIENYHSENVEENLIEIDYHALKTLADIINLAEQFISFYLNKNATCFCFPSFK